MLIPGRLRPYLYSIYAFARFADDFADEGALTSAERLSRLDDWEARLDRCFEGNAEGPVFVALSETAERLGLPKKPLSDLLAAFRRDVTTDRFGTFEDLLNYCELSANPVGRLVLHVFGAASQRNISLSDKICTALQLANFWQDVSLDLQKGRIYLPLEDLERFGYTERELLKGVYNDHFCALLRHEVDRTRYLFHEGRPLVREAPRNLRLELRLTLLGGLMILRKIELARFNVLTIRPSISTLDKLTCLGKAILHYNA